ncbi:MAG TPA: thioredoxin family protein [Phenylobacterium sp.]|nr:thioredoxin family protein [Phenylobacterium sp.]
MFRQAASALLVLAAAAALSLPAAAAPAPKVSIRDYSQLKTPLPYPYDEKADADAQLAKAIARAKAGHKLVLVDLGGNWCGDCRILAGTLDLPEMKSFVAKHFEMISVDVGRFDRNLQIPARYGIHERLEGVPAVLVIDPVTDKQLVGKADVAALADARHMQPQDLANWLAKYAK